MEGVTHKLKWEVYLRVDRHIPHPHPGWWIRREAANVIHQVTRPTRDQLEEDAKWKG